MAPVGDAQLRHMTLTTENQNDFKDAKQEHRLVLANYPLASAPQSTTPPAAPETWPGVTVMLNPGSGELSVSHGGQVANSSNPAAQALRDALPDTLRNRLKKKKKLSGCTVTVEKVGNGWRLTAIEPPE
jgi:hypothetical protein